MIPALLFDKTPADVRLDAPIDATIHIPLNPFRTFVRLLSLVVVAGGAVFALINVALHFDDPTVASKIGLPGGMWGDTVTWVRILQILISALTLLFAVFGVLRTIALLQSREAGLSVGPRGVTVACDLRHPNGQRLPWHSIAAIEHRKLQGIPAVVLRLRAPDDGLRDYRRFGLWPASRIVIQARWLRVAQADLNALLDRYFAKYAAPQSPLSKEAS